MVQKIKENVKAIAGFLTALNAWGVVALEDGAVSEVDWFGLIPVALAGFTVWAATNAPSAAELEALEAFKNN